MVLLFLEMTHLNLCEQQSWDTAEEEVPCMDDAGEPPKDPKHKVYPDTCFNVQVRGQCMHWVIGIISKLSVNFLTFLTFLCINK